MALRPLTRCTIARGALGGVGGALFGLMFSSVVAGIVAAAVIVVATLDTGRTGAAPSKEGPRTLEIDLERR